MMNKTARKHSTFSMARKVVIGFLLLAFVGTFLLMPAAFAEDSGVSPFTVSSEAVEGVNMVTITCPGAGEGENLALVDPDGGVTITPGNTVTLPAAADDVYYACMVADTVSQEEIGLSGLTCTVGETEYTFTEIRIPAAAASSTDSGTTSTTSTTSSTSEGEGDGGDEGGEEPEPPAPLAVIPVSFTTDPATNGTNRAMTGETVFISILVNNANVTSEDYGAAGDGVKDLALDSYAATPDENGLYLMVFSYTVSGKPGNAEGVLAFDFTLLGDDLESSVRVSSDDFSKLYYKTVVSENPNNIRDVQFEKIEDKDDPLTIIDEQYAKDGDTVQVSFLCDAVEDDVLPTLRNRSSIAGRRITDSNLSISDVGSSKKYTFTMELGSGLTHNAPIPFAINLNIGGGQTLTLTQMDAEKPVIFLGAPAEPVTEFGVSGTYEDATGAAQSLPYEMVAARDTLILNYVFDRPVTLDLAPVIVGCSAGASNTDSYTTLAENEYTANLNGSANLLLSYPVPELSTDPRTNLWSYLALYDLAGNKISFIANNKGWQYVTPNDDGAPSDVKLINADMQSASAARVGDALYFTFKDSTIAPHRTLSLSMGKNGAVIQDLKLLRFRNGVSTYSASFKLPDTFDWDDNAVLDFTVNASDLSVATTPSPYFSFIGGQETDFTPTADDHVLTFFAPIRVVSLTMDSNEQAPNNRYARIDSTLKILLTTGHPVDLSEVYVAGVLLTASDMVRHDEAPFNGKAWTITYQLPDPAAADAPSGLDLKDDQAISFSFTMSDEVNPDVTYTYGGEDNSTVIYYAPLTFHNVDAVNSSTPAPKDGKLARNGEELTITFTTGHPLKAGSDIDYELLWGGEALGQTITQKASANPSKSVDDDGVATYTYTTTYVLPAGSVVNGMDKGMADQSLLDVQITARDIFSNAEGVSYSFSDADKPAFKPVQYFAPLTFRDVVVSSSNATPTMYAKAGDTITVEFTTNHALDTKAAGTIGTVQNQADALGITPVRQNSDGTWLYRFTTSRGLADGDVADLGFVEYAFKLEDPAGNAASQGKATSQIRYYAEITATVGISSSNSRSTWAKNGDTITVSASTNHETSITAATIAGRAGTALGDLTISPSAKYLIPGGEASIPEGQLNFSITLQDPAGNTLTVNKTNDSKNVQVTYDRTLPAVTLLPVYSGFSGKDISFLVVYADEHMDPNAISFLMNDAEQITGTDRAAASSGTSFSKSIALTKDNEYRLKGTISDMAGNRCALDATASVILDKTKPVIKVLLDRNTFISGTTPNQIFSVEELHIKDIICSITDQDGVSDWDMDDALVTEGKKTVFLTAEDMAGNTAVPLSYDIYIDGTAPQPTAKDTESGTTLTAGGTTTLAGSKANIQVSLASIHMGDEKPDSFTKLQLLDDKGNVLKDTALSGTNNEGPFIFELPGHGKYTLVLEATDDVGNKTGRITYDISFEAGGLIQLITDGANPGSNLSLRATNPALFYSLVIGLPVLALGIFSLILLLAKRRKGSADMAVK